MTQIRSGYAPARGSSASNVYTVLMVVATAALLCAVAYLWMANTRLTGEGNPLKVIEKPAVK
jgi:hypothetical protein